MSAPSDTPGESRFAAANSTPQQVLSSNTVGLVALSDFRKRRAELLDQQDRDSASSDGLQTPDAAPTPALRSQTGTPKPVLGASTSLESSAGPPKKKKKAAKKGGPAKLSFGGDNDDINDAPVIAKKFKKEAKSSISNGDKGAGDSNGNGAGAPATSYKLKANTAVAFVPRSMTKSALLREAAERETLRKEFLARQEAVKATEIAIPFVFYDGADLPGGVVRVKKGDFIWIFLDKSRKVGAQLGVGEKVNATKVWARVGVDDLVMVRGGVIIPHHYDFLYFIMNKTPGPNDKTLFAYSNEPLALQATEPNAGSELADASYQPLSTAATKAAALPDIRGLEGAFDDPSWTKVVDRRWYERNKHIYPASTWREFDPEKDFRHDVRRDLGGNTFFYS